GLLCRRAAEARRIGAVDQRLGTLGRQVFEPVDARVDVIFPHLARQLVQELDAIAVGVVDVDAVRHAVVDAPVELDALGLQECELLQPRLAARHRQCDVVDRDLTVGEHPLGRRRQVRALDQGNRMVGQLAVIDRAVEAHLRRQRPIRPRVQFADLLEADDLGPEFMRLVDVADIEDQVVDAGRAHSLGGGRRYIGNSIGHRSAPNFDRISGTLAAWVWQYRYRLSLSYVSQLATIAN